MLFLIELLKQISLKIIVYSRQFDEVLLIRNSTLRCKHSIWNFFFHLFVSKRDFVTASLLYKQQVLLSEHVLCKENIVIMKKLGFQILTGLHVFRSP